MLKLYFSSGACSLASHIAFEEAGVDYEAVKIDLKAGEQKTPEYLAVNPAGVTPALATDQGVLSENLAILDYVARIRPDKALRPEDPFAREQLLAVNAWLGSSLHPALSRVLFARPALEGEAREAAMRNVFQKLDLAEQHLLKGPWVLGDAYSTADGYLSVFTRWSRQAAFLDKERYPRLNAHLDVIQARPAVQRALQAQGIAPV